MKTIKKLLTILLLAFATVAGAQNNWYAPSVFHENVNFKKVISHTNVTTNDTDLVFFPGPPSLLRVGKFESCGVTGNYTGNIKAANYEGLLFEIKNDNVDSCNGKVSLNYPFGAQTTFAFPNNPSFGDAGQFLHNIGSGITRWDAIGNYAWGLTGNAGTNPPSNFIGTTDAKDFVFKTYGDERYRIDTNGYWLFNQETPFVLGTNQLSIVNNPDLPADNAQAVIFNSGDGAAINGGTSSDSFSTAFIHSNTSIEQSITSNTTGLVTAYYHDSTSVVMRTEYNGLNFQVQVLDNEGTKNNFTAERNIFSRSLDRDVSFDGMHYGDIERFVGDTFGVFPRYYDKTKIDSVVRVIHATSLDNSKYALRINEDTAQTLLFDSGAAYVKTYYQNNVIYHNTNKPVSFNQDITHVGTTFTFPTNASTISATGTGANGLVLKNLKNSANTSATGTAITIQIDIAGTPYYFLAYPTTAP